MDSPAGKRSFETLLELSKVGAAQVSIVALLLLVLIIDGIDIQLLSLVSPVILEDWGVGRAEFGPAMAGALIGMSGGSLVGGALGDRFGRRSLLVISVIAFGLATILAGMTSSIFWMTALRIVSGFGFGAAAPNAVALANDWLPERARAKVTSLLSIGTPAGGMVGASLVFAVLPFWGWRGTFYACGILTLVVALGMIAFVHESPSWLASKGQEAKARRNIVKVMGEDEDAQAVAFAQEDAASKGKTSGANFLAGRFLRLNIGAGLAFFMTSFVSYALVAWTTIMLTSMGFSMTQALSSVFAFNLAAVGAAIVTGFLIGRLGSKLTLAAGSALLLFDVLALWWVLEANTGQDMAWVVHLLIGGAGGFAGMGLASIYSIMGSGYDVDCRSGGLGFGMTLGRVGGIGASLFGGALLDMGEGSPALFIGVLALASAIGIAGAFISDRHIRPLPGGAGQ